MTSVVSSSKGIADRSYAPNTVEWELGQVGKPSKQINLSSNVIKLKLMTNRIKTFFNTHRHR